MTLAIRNTWNTLNSVLTIINLTLFMILTTQGFDYREVRGRKVPIYLNVALLLILSFAAGVTLYGLVR